MGHHPAAPKPTVRDVMTPAVECLDASASAREAAQVLADLNLGAILVCERGRVLGVITDRDLLIRVMVARRSPRRTRVGSIVERRPESVSMDEDIEAVLHTMAARRVRWMPVTENGIVVGVISATDIAHARETPRVIDLAG